MMMTGVRCLPSATQQGVQRAASTSARQLPMRRRVTIKAVQEEPTSTSPPSASQPAEPQYVRKFRSLGSEVIEQNAPFEEPPAKDMWESDNFTMLGEVLEKWFLPGLVVLGLICGGYAANSYNEDADVFIKPASGPDVLPTVVPASAIIEKAPPVS